jgi:hypothetical protein
MSTHTCRLPDALHTKIPVTKDLIFGVGSLEFDNLWYLFSLGFCPIGAHRVLDDGTLYVEMDLPELRLTHSTTNPGPPDGVHPLEYGDTLIINDSPYNIYFTDLTGSMGACLVFMGNNYQKA